MYISGQILVLSKIAQFWCATRVFLMQDDLNVYNKFTYNQEHIAR